MSEGHAAPPHTLSSLRRTPHASLFPHFLPTYSLPTHAPLSQITKSIDGVRKDLDRALAKEKIAERELVACAAEHASFQRDKQGQLNARDTFVVLRASQIAIGVQPAKSMAPCAPVPGAAATPPAFLLPAAEAGAAPSDAASPLPQGELPPTIDHCVLFR